MWTLIRERLENAFRQHHDVAATLPSLERAVEAGTTTSSAAADELLAIFGSE
jgi:LAO/AO transport system kinase